MEGDSNSLNLRLVAVLGFVLITGLAVHSFIVAVNVADWLKGRLTSVTDQIVTSLGISRVIFQTACIVDVFLIILYQRSANFYAVKACFNFFELSSNYFSIWLATLLSIAFCLKIFGPHHSSLLHLKIMVSQRVTSFIAICGLVSIGHTSFITWLNLSTDLEPSPSSNQTGNFYQTQKALHYVYYFTSANSLPFLIHLASSILLVTFLCLHLQKIRHGNHVTTHLKPFYIGIKFMVVSFIHFALQVVISITIMYYDYLLGFVSSYIIWTGFSCLHSAYLIYRTVRLRNCFLSIFQCGNIGLLSERGDEHNPQL